MKLKKYAVVILAFFCCQVQANVSQDKAKSVTLAVVANFTQNDFQQKIEPLLQQEFSNCSNCQFLNVSAYDEKGEFNSDMIQKSIEDKLGQFQILYFHWNEKLTDQNKALNEFLTKLSLEKNIILIASAGQPKSNEPSATLARTLFGPIQKSIIIGEIGEKDRLIGQSYYGPEMLTALRPPKDLIGQGMSPLLFATRLTKNYNKRQDWVSFFQEKKAKNRRIWLEMGDLFY